MWAALRVARTVALALGRFSVDSAGGALRTCASGCAWLRGLLAQVVCSSYRWLCLKAISSLAKIHRRLELCGSSARGRGRGAAATVAA